MYYRANITKIEECRSPVLPEDLGFLVVTYGPDFVIVETDYLGCHLPDGLQSVPEELCRLLESGRDYPPARALAMEAVERAGLDYASTCERLTRILLERLLRIWPRITSR